VTAYQPASRSDIVLVVLFARRSRPQNCIDKISELVAEVRRAMQMMDAVGDARSYEGDWEASRDYTRDHLTEAWYSLGRALNGLTVGKREPTWGGRVATVDTQRKHIAALTAELNRLQADLSCAEARAHAAEAELARRADPRPGGNERKADSLRRVVLWAVHPDRTADASERKWRTNLVQTLLPEMDKVMKRS